MPAILNNCMDKQDLRTLESWRSTLAHTLQERDGKRNIATELQRIYLEGLLEAITRAIARIKRDMVDLSGTADAHVAKKAKKEPPGSTEAPF